MSRYGMPAGYDAWKTRSPEDEYAMNHPEKFRRGVYTVTVTRTIEAQIEIEVEASSEADAIDDALVKAKEIPLSNWDLDQDDYDTPNVDGPPERDPDDARDERMDRGGE